VLLRRDGLRFLRRPARSPRRAVTTAVVGALLVAVGLVAPTSAGAANLAAKGSGDSGWTPTNWTGATPGPPVPGTGLPAAAQPGQPGGVPQGQYDVDPVYEGQAQCDPVAKPGVQKTADLIKATYGQNQTVWIPRACDVGGQSEHKEGRALDWMTDVRDAQGRANAEAFLSWLLGPDQFGVPYGNAMRLGVMYIGWNDRIWRGYDIKRGWTELKGCFATPATGSDTTCHRNHIHISFTWDGASGRTSFWDGSPMSVPFCDRQKSGATQVASGRAADVTPVGAVRVLSTRKAIGIASPCRLEQDRWNGDSHRLYVKVTGQGGVPATGVAAVQVQVAGLGSNANTSLRIWSPGQSKSQVVVKEPMNMDATGTAIVPVASDGTIALANSYGATDVTVDVTGYYPAGDTPNVTSATPGGTSPMADEPAPANPAPGPTPEPAPSATFSPPPVDEFISIGSEVGYDSAGAGPLQPGEERVVGLSGVPGEATAALALVTTRDASKRGMLRLGAADKDASATFAFPKRAARSAVMVLAVSGGQVKVVAPKKASVQVRVQVLGYSLNGKAVKVRSAPATRIVKSKLDGTTPLVVGPVTGVAGLPKKGMKVTGVILQVTTKGLGADGTLKSYGLDGAAPGTSSAPITSGKKYTTLLVTEIGTDGKIVLAPSVPSRVKATIVGWVKR
jgi:hypothetical protein